MKSKKFLTIDSLMATIRMRIPEGERINFSNLNLFIKTLVDSFVDSKIPQNYYEHMVVPVFVNNYKGEFPNEIERIGPIFGTFEMNQSTLTANWREDIVGVIEKRSDGCSYTVIADCDECNEVDCCHPIVLASQEAQHMLDVGSRSFITKQYLPSMDEEQSHYGNYFLMMPTRSSFFSAPHIYQDMGFYVREATGDISDYEIYNGIIKTKFEKGVVLVSGTGKLKDSKGGIKIPDSKAFLELINSYILKEVYEHLWRVKKSPEYRSLMDYHVNKFEKMDDVGISEFTRIDYSELVSALADFRSGNLYPNTVLDALQGGGNSRLKAYKRNIDRGNQFVR